uniref:Coat protein n=1 Tax=Beauveria bassiana partitivirus 4 TaxID=3071797 RepID=A0AA51HKQ8_9VIRU|nr:coat protein [Beauveria bassiana partitivirus 4]
MEQVENAPTPPASIAPSDSVSQLPAADKRKNRPGKNARQRQAQSAGPASNVSSGVSQSKADTFATRSRSAPSPQPGRFPVVFQTGAGEPTSDRFFSIDENPLYAITGSFSQMYLNHPMYAQFSNYAGYSDNAFELDLSRAFLLSLAQQVVHSHVNMGLPLGDFSSVSSTDVYLPMALRSIVQQMGEFSVPALGVRYLLKDYASTVSALVFAASRIGITTKGSMSLYPVRQLWLPMSPTDERTRHTLALRLSEFASTHGVVLDPETLTSFVHVAPSPAFNAVKTLLPGIAENPNKYDFLFSPLGTVQEWVSAYGTPNAQSVLSELGLWWDTPRAADLNFSFVAKVSFPSLVESWSRKRATMEKYFACGSGLANKASAVGSPAILSRVSKAMGITKIEAQVGLDAPSFSLLACFPLSVRFHGDYAVKMVTAIPVANRAIEFAQQDWKN